MTTRNGLPLLVVLALMAVPVPALTQQTQPVFVEGKTVTRGGTSAPYIVIRAIRGGVCIEETKSGPSGTYRISVQPGTPFDLVFSCSPTYEPTIVPQLSGAAQHQIVKVMLRPEDTTDTQSVMLASLAGAYIKSLQMAPGVRPREETPILAALSGRVGGVAGALVPGVTVSLKSPNGETLTTVTGLDGSYRFSGVEPGSYSLEFSVVGFRTVRREVSVTAGGEDVTVPMVLLEEGIRFE